VVVVMNSDTGDITNSVAGPLRSDDPLFDVAQHRLYMPGGDGFIGIYDTSDPDHLRSTATVPSTPGAKTGILLPDQKKIILAVSPGETKAEAKVITFGISGQ